MEGYLRTRIIVSVFAHVEDGFFYAGPPAGRKHRKPMLGKEFL